MYNAAKAYSIVRAGLTDLPVGEQILQKNPPLHTGENYTLLNPVIALTITDFEMFPNHDKVISRFVLKEKEFLVDYLIDDIELVFVELPKFSNKLDELDTLTEKWLYFLKSARSLATVPETMGRVPEIEKAFELANQANLSRDELEELNQREIFIHDQRNAIQKAVRQGIEQGIEQGMREAQVEIAKRLLNVLDEETISQTTGLSLEEIQRLKSDR